MSKILTIAFPSKGVTDPAFAVALKLLQIKPPFSQMEVLYVAGADVAVARNTLCEDIKGDYIFFVDDDVLPPPETIMELLKDNKDIVCGLYFARQRPHFPQIFLRNRKEPERYDSIINYTANHVFEVDACGAGCMLIKKEVFDKLKKPYFNYIPRGENNLRKGEDFYFCEKAKEAGFKIYCDSSIVCKHIATSFIGPEHWAISMEKLKEIEERLGPEGFEKYKENVRKLNN